ncbi:MAG: alpha/beta fold hydrolase, partial [Solirubrobacteraceae bacterium]|nr:alpha/beta fold hydrolase [Solirubrobacteraceae bacterium]
MAASQHLNYHRQGTGTPLVLVHGIGATWQCWKPLIPALATQHDVIVPDLPGFGGSVHLGVERPSLEHFAHSILELLDELGVDEFHVAGNSLGGAVSLELLRSGRALSYHGVSPAGQTYGPYLDITKAFLRGAYYGSRAIAGIAPTLLRLRPLRALFLAQMLGRPWHVSREHAVDLVQGCAVGAGFERTLAHAIPGDRGLDIPDYDGPAQILWGTRDLILPVSSAARYVEKWPSMDFIPMKGLGHVPMQDDPQLIADLILTLTRRTDAAARREAAP